MGGNQFIPYDGMSPMNQLNSNASELTLQQMASHENMMMFAQAAMKASNSFYNSQNGIDE